MSQTALPPESVTSTLRPRRVTLRDLHHPGSLLESIAGAAIEGILVVDETGRITYYNRRFAEIWRIPDDVLASRSDEMALAAVRDKLLDPQAFLDRVEYLYDHPLEHSQDEIRLLDGRILDRHSAPVVDDDGSVRGRVWFFRDVSEARRNNDATELLARSGQLFGSSLDVEQTLGQLAHLIVPRMADWMAVDVIGDAGDFRRVAVAHVEPGGEELLRALDRRYPLRPGEGRLRGKVVATGEPIALYDVDERQLTELARNGEHLDMLHRLGVASALWIPLLARDRVMGVMSLGYTPGVRRYTPPELELLSELARRAALAVDNGLLFRAVDRAERRQAAVAQLGQRALAGAPLGELMDEAARTLAETMEVPFSEVLELAPDGKRLRLVAGVGWRAGSIGKVTVDAGLGSQGGYTLSKVGPVIVEEMASETRFRPPRLLLDHRVVSGLTVIIGSQERPVGVLGAFTDRRQELAEDDVNFAQAVANVLGAAVERERSRARLELLALAEQARAAELRAVISSMGEAVVVCDAAGSVVLANPAAEELLGGRLRRGIGGILRAFVWPAGIERRLVPGQAVEVRLARGRRRSGADAEDDRWLEILSYAVRTPDDGVDAGTILVLRDVTDQRNARAVREAFAGILSHELRTPVTTIYGGSEMLLRAALTDDERGELHQDIRSEADRLYRLVENLLVLSHVEQQGLELGQEPVLLQRLVPRVVKSEGQRWPEARFELDLQPGLPPVTAEETYLEQVIRNLLGNAAKYGGDGVITVRATENENGVIVRVLDNGPGFGKDDEPHLFELFYRAPDATRRAGGAGIGLFVTQQLVQAMGGRIWATNRPEGGAEFGFEVPYFDEVVA